MCWYFTEKKILTILYFICLMLYIYHNAHMYIRRFSIYIIDAYPYIYTYEIILHTYQCIYVWDNDHASTQIYPSYTYICASTFIKILFHSYVLHNNVALKAPTQKMPSAFQVSWKSSKLPLSFVKLQAHSIFWSSQNHLIKSRLRVSVLRYYSPSFLTK